MKRALIPILVSFMLLLSGCSGGISESRRAMEHLRPIQTVSFDRQEDGVVMGISSGIGPKGYPPLVMQCSAAGIEPAIARLQSFSPEDELFYAHVRFLLLGESMAEGGLMPLLDWVERSPSMRTDTSLILVRGSAAEALTSATGEATDITERLASLEHEESAHGQHIYSLREIAAALLERGGALCLVVRSEPSDQLIISKREASDAIVPEGYAVLREGKPAEYLTFGETMGAELLEGGVNGAVITLDGYSLEFFSDGADVTGTRNEAGLLTGISVRCEAEAGILEQPGHGENDLTVLEEALSAAVSSWIRDVISRSREMGCDFLDLKSSVWKTAPLRGQPKSDAEDIFSVPVTVSVRVSLDRSFDLPNQA